MRRIKHKIRKGKCGRIWGNCWAEIVTEGLAVISVILRNTNVNWMSWGDGNLMMLLFWILLFWCFYFVFLSITQLILRNKTLQLKDSKLLLYVNVFSPQSHFFFFFFLYIKKQHRTRASDSWVSKEILKYYGNMLLRDRPWLNILPTIYLL